jgi:hypothetical protein
MGSFYVAEDVLPLVAGRRLRQKSMYLICHTWVFPWRTGAQAEVAVTSSHPASLQSFMLSLI